MKEGFLVKANYPILGNTRLNRSVSADLLLYHTLRHLRLSEQPGS